MLHRLAELDLLRPIHASLQHANFQLPFIDILPLEFGEITIPDILSFKRTLGWILWLMPLSAFDIEVISRRLDFPGHLTKSALAVIQASCRAALPRQLETQPVDVLSRGNPLHLRVRSLSDEARNLPCATIW